MNRACRVVWSVAAAGALAACTQHKVEVSPIEVKPIHMTVDINIKVDRELDEFFAFEEEIGVPAATQPVPASPGEATGQEGVRR